MHEVKVVLHAEVVVIVKVNVARSPEEAELQAQGVDVMSSMFERDDAGFTEDYDPNAEPGTITDGDDAESRQRPKLRPQRPPKTRATKPRLRAFRTRQISRRGSVPAAFLSLHRFVASLAVRRIAPRGGGTRVPMLGCIARSAGSVEESEHHGKS